MISAKVYLSVFAALLGFTALTTGIAFVDLGRIGNISVALTIAVYAPGARVALPWLVRYEKVPRVTAAMHTQSCCSSNGRSSGPALQMTSCTVQPRPDARRCEEIAIGAA